MTEEYAGKAIEILGSRRGEMLSMQPHGDQVRIEFEIPARGLIGVRALLLNATCGEATLSHRFKEYGPWRGSVPTRSTGAGSAWRSTPSSGWPSR